MIFIHRLMTCIFLIAFFFTENGCFPETYGNRKHAYTWQTHHWWCGEAVGFECEHVPRLCLQMSRPRRTSLNPLSFLFFLCLPKHSVPHPQLNKHKLHTGQSQAGSPHFCLFIQIFLKKETGPHYVAILFSNS